MVYLVFLAVCFGASVLGAICGVGGGVIIKPVLDAFGVLDVSAVSFLSGCTVLAMTACSVMKEKLSGKTSVQKSTSMPLALGAAAGGVIGKWLFSYLLSHGSSQNKVGAVQAVCLMFVTLGTLLYTLNKHRIRTYSIENAAVNC